MRAIDLFLNWANKPYEDLEEIDFRNYLLFLIDRGDLDINTINMYNAAVRFYLQVILEKNVNYRRTARLRKEHTSVKINLQRAVVTEEKTIRLIATVNPLDATNKQVTWSSSNNYIAKVDSAGTVTGLHSGTCQITATTKDGSKKKSSVQLTVEPKIPVDCVTFTRKGYFGVYTQAGPGLKNITKTRTMKRIDFEIVVNYGSTNAKTYSCYYDHSKLGPGGQLRNWWYDIPGLTYSHSYAVRLESVRYSDGGYDYFSNRPIIGIFN